MSVFGPDLDLLRRLHVWLDPIGVQVNEVAGWQQRGRTYATFDPYGSVNHHTAGGIGGVAPSLGICINGRSDLPGPLCNVHQQRDRVVNLVAAGVANHAGPGSWRGLSGNQSVFGLEVEHIGSAGEPFSNDRWDISCRIHAAFLSGLGSPDVGRHCQHFEWSTQGKIDFFAGLLPGGAQGMRDRVAHYLATGPGAQPQPKPPAPAIDYWKDDNEMLYIASFPDPGVMSLVDPSSGFFLDFAFGSDIGPYTAAGVKVLGNFTVDHRTRLMQACANVNKESVTIDSMPTAKATEGMPKL
jgi:hypothetical protein